MATDIPLGYHVQSGTWDTDIEFATDRKLAGDGSIHFLATSPSNNPAMESDLCPCAPLQPILLKSWAQASDVTGGNTIFAWLRWYTNAAVYISDSVIFSDEMTTEYTWQQISGTATAPATAGFVSILFGKVIGDYDVWFAEIAIKEFPKCAWGYRSAALTWPQNAVIPLDAERYDHGSICDIVTNHRIDIPSTDLYSVTGFINAAVAAGKNIRAIVLINGATLISGSWGFNDSAVPRSTTSLATMGPTPLNFGDYVELYLASDDAAGTLGTGATVTFLSVAQVH